MARSLREFEQESQATPSNTEVPIPAAEGNPVVKESTVIIDGKERPLKNYEAELRRKHEEDKEALRKEYDSKLLSMQQPAPQPTAPQQTWYDLVQQKAEQEMAYTGKAIPIQTILELADNLYQRNMSATFKSREQADKEVRNFKRSIKKDPDFVEIEDEFDTLVDNLDPKQINLPTLEVILNSVRGKKVQEIRTRAREEGRQDALKDTQILGNPVETITGGTPPKTSLTAEQRAELDGMNRENTMEWSEKEYLDALVKKQNRFKVAGAKNNPMLMNEAMNK